MQGIQTIDAPAGASNRGSALPTPVSVLSASALRMIPRCPALIAALVGHGLVITAIVFGVAERPIQPASDTVPVVEIVPVPPDMPGPVPAQPEAVPQTPPLADPPPQSRTTADATQQPAAPPQVAAMTPPPADVPSSPVADANPRPDISASPAPAPQPLPVPPQPPPRAPAAPRAAPIRHTAARLPDTLGIAAASALPAREAAASPAAISRLTGRIREAVQAAVRCSVVARMMHQSGRAGIVFDYRDGALTSAPGLARSSGAGPLDTAALAAVRSAHYPPAPPDAAGQTLNLLVWVEEDCGN